MKGIGLLRGTDVAAVSSMVQMLSWFRWHNIPRVPDV